MSEDVFEITDFTTASDWERFISGLEEVITRWDLCGKDTKPCALTSENVSKGVWSQKHETIRFSKTSFSIVYHKLELIEDKDVDEEENQLCPESLIDGERTVNDWPIKSHCLFRWFGVKEFLLISTNDDSINSEDRLRLITSSATIALTQTSCKFPLFCQYSGRLRRLFSGVCLNTNLETEYQMIHSNHTTKQFKYLSDFLDLFKQKVGENICQTVMVSIRVTYSLSEFPFECVLNDESLEISSDRLIVTAINDPLIELQMAALWSSLAEDVIIDSENHSDLDPNSAEKWSLRVLFRDQLDYSLSQALELLLDLKQNKTQILDEMIKTAEEEDMKEALIALTKDNYNEKWIKDLVKELFKEEINESSGDDLKSAPKGSLVWKISVLVSNIYFKDKQTKDIKVFWKEFVAKLTQCWEQSRLISCDILPNLNYCLFHQKIQMLNKCIIEKRSDSEEEDEFYDCEPEMDLSEGKLFKSEIKRVNCQEFIWVPRTQQLSPMTEDMIEEQQTMSQTLRATLHSKALLSDMQAFKAANIGATFECFVKWHSPRDYDEESGLSSRFQSKDNVWRELWETAEAVPIKRQKKLFDYITEAEKVLHFLTSLSFSDLVDLIINCVINCCLNQIKQKRFELDFNENSLDERLVKEFCLNQNYEPIVDLIRGQEIHLKRFESLIKKFNNESNVEIKDFVLKLMSEPEIQIQSYGSFAQIIRKMFAENQMFLSQKKSIGERDLNVKSLPDPIAKEFILRVWSPRPASYSRSVPQRMYCLVSPQETRIAGTFSRDLTFY